jgi:hypothetical protein
MQAPANAVRKNTENMNAQNHALAWHDQPARK